MKFWCSISLILLLIFSVIIWQYDNGSLHYYYGLYYEEAFDDKSAIELFHKSGIKGHKKARQKFRHYFYSEVLELEFKYSLDVLRWEMEAKVQEPLLPVKKLHQAVINGETDKVYELGLIYFDGINTNRNKVMGCALFRLAETRLKDNSSIDIFNEGLVTCAEAEMTHQEIVESKEKTKELLNKMK